MPRKGVFDAESKLWNQYVKKQKTNKPQFIEDLTDKQFIDVIEQEAQRRGYSNFHNMKAKMLPVDS